MFQLLQQFIGYTGSQYTNIDQYLIYGSIVIGLLMIILFVDLLYRLIRAFIKK